MEWVHFLKNNENYREITLKLENDTIPVKISKFLLAPTLLNAYDCIKSQWNV